MMLWSYVMKEYNFSKPSGLGIKGIEFTTAGREYMGMNDTIVAVDYATQKISAVLTPAIANGWEMYRTQMIIEGYASIFYGLIMLAGIYVCYRFVKWANGLEDTYSNEFVRDCGPMIVIVVAGALLIFGIPEIINGVMHVLNPDYYVLKDLIGALT